MINHLLKFLPNYSDMKNLFVLLIAVFVLGSMTSCATTYKKRKGCKGNGSWYGNRNLSATNPQNAKQQLYVLAPTTEVEANF